MLISYISIFLECLILVVYLAFSLNLHYKIKFITCCGSILLIEEILITVNSITSQIFLIAIVLSTILLFITLYERKISLSLIKMILQFFLIFYVCSLLCIFILNTFHNILGYDNSLNSLSLESASFLSNILLTSVLTFIYFYRSNELSYSIKKFIPTIALEILVIFVLGCLLYTLVYKSYTLLIIGIIIEIVIFILIIITFINLINNEMHLQSLKLKRQSELLTKENHKQMMELKNELERYEHKYIYALHCFKSQLCENNLVPVQEIIENQLNELSMFATSITTGNEFFDSILSIKIKNLWNQGRQIKSTITISNNNYYNTSNFVYLIIDILEIIHKYSIYNIDIELIITEKNGYIILSFITFLLEKSDFLKTFEYFVMEKPIKKYAFHTVNNRHTLKLIYPMN